MGKLSRTGERDDDSASNGYLMEERPVSSPEHDRPQLTGPTSMLRRLMKEVTNAVQ